MKTNNPVRKFSFFPASIPIAIALIVFSSCHKSSETTIDNRPYTISGNATGSQVVPAVADSGSATITGTYNPSTHVLNYTSNWTSLSGGPVSAGFYNGAMGASGIAIGSAWSVSGGSTGTVTGNVTLTENEAAQLLAGQVYYTYATANHPTGELRGQISTTR